MTKARVNNSGRKLVDAYVGYIDCAAANVAQQKPPEEGPAAEAADRRLMAALRRFLTSLSGLPDWMVPTPEEAPSVGEHVEDVIFGRLANMSPEGFAKLTANAVIALWVVSHIFGVVEELLDEELGRVSDELTFEEYEPLLFAHWRFVLQQAPLPAPLARLLVGGDVERAELPRLLEGVTPTPTGTTPLWASTVEPRWTLGYRIAASEVATAPKRAGWLLRLWANLDASPRTTPPI